MANQCLIRSRCSDACRTRQTRLDPPEVHVQPDRMARYDSVAAVLSTSQRVGLPKVGVVGLEQFAP
jgi:biopolymer transport protein ExbD